MARDDWRIRIELEDDRAGGLLERLGLDLGSDARELANELEDERLAVTRDGDTVFVYAATGLQAEQARRVVEAQLAEEGLEARSVSIEHWLRDEERWNEAAKPPVRESGPVEGARRNPEVPPEEAATWEEEVAARGYAPWEVRIECDSHEEAEELADQLEREGYSVVGRWRYVIAGTNTREEAAELARRLQGEVQPGGELVYEVPTDNPFAVFAFRNPF